MQRTVSRRLLLIGGYSFLTFLYMGFLSTHHLSLLSRISPILFISGTWHHFFLFHVFSYFVLRTVIVNSWSNWGYKKERKSWFWLRFHLTYPKNFHPIRMSSKKNVQIEKLSDVALFGKARRSCRGLCHSPISWWDCILFTKSFATAQSWKKIAHIL